MIADRTLLDRELAAARDADWRLAREVAAAVLAARVDADLTASGETACNTRGKAQAVGCLDAFGYDGRAIRFPTSTAAGQFVALFTPDREPATADHVRRAIVRGGTCGGRRFGWANGRQVTAAG